MPELPLSSLVAICPSLSIDQTMRSSSMAPSWRQSQVGDGIAVDVLRPSPFVRMDQSGMSQDQFIAQHVPGWWAVPVGPQMCHPDAMFQLHHLISGGHAAGQRGNNVGRQDLRLCLSLSFIEVVDRGRSWRRADRSCQTKIGQGCDAALNNLGRGQG